MNERLLGIAGIMVILAIAVALSSNRRAIRLRVVGAAFALQATIAFLVLYTPWGRAAIEGLSAGVANLLGYANRKLGDKAKAMTYYTKALNIEPKHLGANEYMGELYLEMNDLPKAEERLAVLKNACGDCDEFDDLEDEIEDYKEEHGLS